MEPSAENKVGRRRFLKVITAGSAAIVASAFLPEKWMKPIVHSGVLPVHAATSVVAHMLVDPTTVAPGYPMSIYPSVYVYTDTVTMHGSGRGSGLASLRSIKFDRPGTPLIGVNVRITSYSVTPSTGDAPTYTGSPTDFPMAYYKTTVDGSTFNLTQLDFNYAGNGNGIITLNFNSDTGLTASRDYSYSFAD